MLGYNLRDVVSMEANHTERFVVLNLKFLSYQLFIDDDHKLQELITKLQSFQKPVSEKKDSEVNMPKFYKESSTPNP